MKTIYNIILVGAVGLLLGVIIYGIYAGPQSLNDPKVIIIDEIGSYEPWIDGWTPEIRRDDWAETAHALDVPFDALTWELYEAHLRYGNLIFQIDTYYEQILQMRGQ